MFFVATPISSRAGPWNLIDCFPPRQTTLQVEDSGIRNKQLLEMKKIQVTQSWPVRTFYSSATESRVVLQKSALLRF